MVVHARLKILVSKTLLSYFPFAEWYNNRVQGALDLEYFETPNGAFIRKMCGENTLRMFTGWSERAISL